MTASRRIRNGVVRDVHPTDERVALRSWLRALKDTSGAAAVEFAIVALPFLILVFLALQTAIVFLAGQALQTATNQAARLVLTGQAQSQGLTAATFKQTVCANLPNFFNCSNVWVDMQSSGSFTTINTAPIVPTYDPTTGKVTNTFSYSTGAPDDVVILRVMYDWPIIGGPFGFANQSNGTFLMVGTAVFKNEPYNSGLES